MATISFDTLKFSNRLKAAGVPDKQAEAETEALAEVLEVNLKDLATREDILLVRKDIAELESRLNERTDSRLALLEQRMTIKLGGLMVVAVGAVATLVKLL